MVKFAKLVRRQTRTYVTCTISVTNQITLQYVVICMVVCVISRTDNMVAILTVLSPYKMCDFQLVMVLFPCMAQINKGKTSVKTSVIICQWLSTCKQCPYKRMLHLQLVPVPSAGTLGRHIFHHGSDSSLATRFHVCRLLFQGPLHPPWPWTSVKFLCLLQMLPVRRHHDLSSEKYKQYVTCNPRASKKKKSYRVD